MKLLVTGSRGFIGGSVGRCAAVLGHDVLGVARSSQPEADWPGRYVQADVLHAPLSDLIADFAPDAVLHGAGTASVGASLAAPLEDLRAAVLTWANTLESIRLSGVRPVILFPSSAAVYGSPESLPVSEEAPVSPVSPYGFHKAACELVARGYAECFGLNIVVCRLFSVFGVRQRRLLVWELFNQLVGPGPAVHLQGTGRESRDYLPADDLAAALLGLAAHPSIQGPALQAEGQSGAGRLHVLNLCRGRETPVLELAHLMSALYARSALCGAEKTICCREMVQPGQPARWVGDPARLRGLLPDWQPRPLEDSLSQCMEAWRHTSPGSKLPPSL